MLHPIPPGVSCRGGFVLCYPFGHERTNSHRLMFEWARALSAMGFWALRFDYRGTGDSAGVFTDTTAADYVADTLTAVAELKRVSGITRLGLGGLRLGATVAALASREVDTTASLVLWEPILVGTQYRDQLLRTAMANAMVNSGGTPGSRAKYKEDLKAGKTVSVDGFDMTRNMYDSLADMGLSECDRPTSGPVFVAQIDASEGRPVRKPLKNLVDRFSETGPTSLSTVAAPPAWIRLKTWGWRPLALFGRTAEWLDQHCTNSDCEAATALAAEVATSRQQSGVTESVVGFEFEGKRVWGVLHRPDDESANRPRVIMLPAGDTPRSAVFYLWITRAMAKAGWTVFRFDPRSIGDSDGDFGLPTLPHVHRQIDEGVLVPDGLAAMDFLDAQFGPSKYILTGLCGGGTTSAYIAAHEPRVSGLAPFEIMWNLTAVPNVSANEEQQYFSLTQRALESKWAFILMPMRRVYLFVKERLKVLVPRRSAAKGTSAPRSEDSEWVIQRLGKDGNSPLVHAFGQAMDRRIPILAVFGDTDEPRHFEALKDRLFADHADENVTDLMIEGADHNFIMPGKPQKLTRIMLDWLADPARPWATSGDAT